MSSTHRLGLPCLSTGQAQKEVTHNEALQRLDIVVQATFTGAQSNNPPNAPALGQVFLCGEAPSGAWAGHPLALAAWTAGGWRYQEPFDGLSAVQLPTGLPWTFVEGNWAAGSLRARELRIEGKQVVGARSKAVLDPTGGSIVDSEARRALTAILAALRAHGLIES